MAETRCLAEWRLTSRWSRLLTTLFFAAMMSSCATSRLSNGGVEPRVRWVLADMHSLGGKTVQVVGHPRIQSEGRVKMMEFDGRKDALVLPIDPLEGLECFTIELLIRPDLDGPSEQRFFHTEDKAGQRVLVELRLDDVTRHWCLDTYLHASLAERRTLIDRTKTHAAGQWHWVALIYDGTTMAHYVSAIKELEGPVRFPPMSTGETSIGVRLNRVAWFKGAIQEVRIYDRALTARQLSR